MENVNPYVNLKVDQMKETLKLLRFQLTGKGSAIVGGILVDMERVKENAQPQCPPDESAVHRGCRIND
ncbi:MAG TPA: hypothetical protein DCS48_07830 [Desulfovibrio sp.]|nr:hypothetical protein [Desulfovibrio sp.]